MPYGLIAIIGAIALSLYHVLATEASYFSKALVTGVLAFCLACIYWLHLYMVAAYFLLAGLGVFITFHRICEQARWPKRRD